MHESAPTENAEQHPGEDISTSLPDEFQIEEKLGEGAYGVVYRARNQILQNDVAIKILLKIDEKGIKRLKIEASIAGKLRHNNIARALSFGHTKTGAPYIVYELIHGITLRQRLNEGPLSPGEFRAIFTGILQGMACAHDAGLVHRDLKPSNVMLLKTDPLHAVCLSAEDVKILDFGIARSDGTLLPQDQGLTASDDIPGTPEYMSPEQCASRPLDARSDLYSIGCMMYEALSGAVPLRGDSAVHTIFRQLNDEVPQLCVPGLPAALRDLVQRLLSKQADQRPGSATAVITELQKIPDWDPKGSPSPTSRSHGQTNVTLAVSLAILLLISLCIPLLQKSSAPNLSIPTTIRKSKISPISSIDMDVLNLWRGIHEAISNNDMRNLGKLEHDAVVLKEKLDKGKATASQYFSYYMVLGQIYQLDGRTALAADAFKSAVNLCTDKDGFIDQAAFNPVFRLSCIEMEAENYKQATEYIKLAMKLHNMSELREKIAVVPGIHIADDRKVAVGRLLYFEGFLEWRKNNIAAYKDKLERSLLLFEALDHDAKAPSTWAIYTVMGLFDCAIQEKNFQKAKALALKAEKYAIPNPTIAQMLALRIIQVGRHQQAEKFVKLTLELTRGKIKDKEQTILIDALAKIKAHQKVFDPESIK